MDHDAKARRLDLTRTGPGLLDGFHMLEQLTGRNRSREVLILVSQLDEPVVSFGALGRPQGT